MTAHKLQIEWTSYHQRSRRRRHLLL